MVRKSLTTALVGAMLLGASGCATSAADLLNPFQEAHPKELGEPSMKPLLEESGGGEAQASQARHELEVMAAYRRKQDPQPYYPVVQPAEVRLMWIPDHKNKNGDLVPAHYYYLRVLDDRWAVEDAFELEEQLNASSKGAGGATPWVYGETTRRR